MKGIYQYKDLETDEVVYVGKDSHIDKYSRHKDHKTQSKYDQQQINRVIQNNPERYEYSVLYSSDDVSDNDLKMLEISFIERYNPKFNFTKGGDGLTGFKHSEESKQKMSEIQKGENNSFYGKHHSKESKQKISEANKGHVAWNKGKTDCYSDETLQKWSEARKGRESPNKGKKRTDESNLKTSKTLNTSGYYRVTKKNCKSCKKGFIWLYQYYKDGKQKHIHSVSLKTLEEKVKAKNLPWYKLGEVE